METEDCRGSEDGLKREVYSTVDEYDAVLKAHCRVTEMAVKPRVVVMRSFIKAPLAGVAEVTEDR